MRIGPQLFSEHRSAVVGTTMRHLKYAPRHDDAFLVVQGLPVDPSPTEPVEPSV
jgi:hypothetical protein